jgi:hypothetical protein
MQHQKQNTPKPDKLENLSDDELIAWSVEKAKFTRKEIFFLIFLIFLVLIAIFT